MQLLEKLLGAKVPPRDLPSKHTFLRRGTCFQNVQRIVLLYANAPLRSRFQLRVLILALSGGRLNDFQKYCLSIGRLFR